MKTVAVLLCLLCVTPLAAQVRFNDVVVSDQYLGWWGRTLADVNKDGLLDVVVLKQSRGYGKVTPGWLGWYQAEDGGKRWSKHVIEDNDLLGSGDLAAGDIDGDGDIDILSFEADETNKDTTARMYWFENQAPKTLDKWKKHFIGNNPEFVKDVELADFNQDGRLDIVTIVFGRQTLEIHTQGKNNTWTKTTSMVIPNLHEGMALGDIDGDKDIDIVTCGYWVENPGKKGGQWNLHNINEKWHNQTPDGGLEWRRNGTKVFCQDLNGDGRAEVFFSHSEANRDGYPVAWYEAKDPKGTWTEHVIAENYRHCHTLQVFDMDNDGDMDVVTGEIPEHPTQKRVRIFLNKGNNLDWQEQVLGNEGIYNGLVGDLDGDGDYDIFTAPGFSNSFPVFKVYVNQTK
jgi:FG-GAP-like repeat